MLAADVLSGLPFHVSGVRGRLRGAWSVYGAWSRHEPPCQALPILGLLLDALLGWFSFHGFFDVALVAWALFDGLLRTDEAMGLNFLQMDFGVRYVTLTLTDTKTSEKKGGHETTYLTDPTLTALLRRFRETVPRNGLVLQRSPRQFRAVFAEAVDKLLVQSLNLKPYGLKRGGATDLFVKTGSLDTVVERGRWSNTRTARVYVNTAFAMRTQREIPAGAKSRLRAYARMSPRGNGEEK